MESNKINVKIHDTKYRIDFTNNLKTLQNKLLPIIKEEYKNMEMTTFDDLYLLYLDKEKDLICIIDEKDYNIFLKYNKETCLEIEEKKDFDEIDEIDEILDYVQ